MSKLTQKNREGGKRAKTAIPNGLTALRMVLSFALLFLNPYTILFIIPYLICGLTDILDGFLARKWNCQTTLGARLDSLADFCMCLMILVAMMKQMPLSQFILLIILAVLIIRVVNAVIFKIKFGKLSSIHTIDNKLTGLLLFLCPLLFSLLGSKLLMAIGIAAVLSAIEETLILLTSKAIDLNRKSIFMP